MAASLLLGGCSAGPVGESASGSPTGPPLHVEVTYFSGSVQGGVNRRPVGLGRAVRLVVRSDVSDEVHVHGYDRRVDVPANGTATVEFVADRSGVFEVELEARGVQLTQLEVR
ncbi:MAG: hypothetical protein ACT4O0_10865 [Pseudonocardia sp.]